MTDLITRDHRRRSAGRFSLAWEASCAGRVSAGGGFEGTRPSPAVPRHTVNGVSRRAGADHTEDRRPARDLAFVPPGRPGARPLTRDAQSAGGAPRIVTS